MDLDSDLTKALRPVIKASGCTVPELKEQIDRWLLKGLLSLVENGEMAFGDPRHLGGLSLQAKVSRVFKDLGFDVKTPDEVRLATLTDLPPFDGLMTPPAGIAPDRPVVLEVKSGKELAPTTEHLRQLDDYVYQVSGEEHFRKRSMALRYEPFPVAGMPMMGAEVHYPKSYKGVLVYNCTQGTHFDNEPKRWLGYNEVAFAEKRDFCVSMLRCLLDWHKEIQAGRREARDLWEAMHKTQGELDGP